MSVQACAELVRKGDPDRFLSAMATPPETRAVLFPIYAFNVEIARAPWAASEPFLAEMRVQWWVDVLDQIIAGQTPRKHEVALPLAQTISAEVAHRLKSAAEARRLDCDPETVFDLATLQSYLADSSGAVYGAAGLAVGAAKDCQPALGEIGYAAGLANWLRAVPELHARGRKPLEHISAEELAGLARDAQSRLADARRGVKGNGRWVSRAAWLADRTLRSAAANPESVRDGSLHNPEILRRGSLLWRVLRGAA
jgi:phytoene/squalene synthetase